MEQLIGIFILQSRKPKEYSGKWWIDSKTNWSCRMSSQSHCQARRSTTDKDQHDGNSPASVVQRCPVLAGRVSPIWRSCHESNQGSYDAWYNSLFLLSTVGRCKVERLLHWSIGHDRTHVLWGTNRGAEESNMNIQFIQYGLYACTVLFRDIQRKMKEFKEWTHQHMVCLIPLERVSVATGAIPIWVTRHTRASMLFIR